MNHRPNSIVYNLRGERARYVVNSSQGHVVMPEVAIIDGEGDERIVEADVVTWHEVFVRPPRAVLDEEITRLNQQVETLQGAVSAARKEGYALEAEMKERKARFAKHKALDQLDAFLAQKITHYVRQEQYYGISIISLKDTGHDYYRDRFKLLSLFGGSDGNLTWKLNDYYDGSGSWSQCYPVCSLQEAEAKRAELFAAYWTMWRVTPKEATHLNYYVESARKEGVSVPDDVAAEIKTWKVRDKVAQVARYEKELADAKAALLAAQNA